VAGAAAAGRPIEEPAAMQPAPAAAGRILWGSAYGPGRRSIGTRRDLRTPGSCSRPHQGIAHRSQHRPPAAQVLQVR
jgi:hypothetical protein